GDDVERADVVHRKAGHETRAIRRHREHSGLTRNSPAAKDHAGSDLVNEHIGVLARIREPDYKLPVRSTNQLAEESRIGAEKRGRRQSGRSRGRRSYLNGE